MLLLFCLWTCGFLHLFITKWFLHPEEVLFFCLFVLENGIKPNMSSYFLTFLYIFDHQSQKLRNRYYLWVWYCLWDQWSLLLSEDEQHFASLSPWLPSSQQNTPPMEGRLGEAWELVPQHTTMHYCHTRAYAMREDVIGS